jgi:hypothetical protein
MKKHTYLGLIIFLVISQVASVAVADEPPYTVDVLGAAILRLKTGERGNLAWRECGAQIRDEEAALRASQYAEYLIEEYNRDAAFNPWIAASIIMQESSFNRCAVSGAEWVEVRRQFSSEGRDMRERDIVRVLASRRLRTRYGVGTADFGLAQFRWPGMVGQFEIRDPAELMDARTSIRILASAMVNYRRQCDSVTVYRGVHTWSSGRVRRYSVPCADGYWVQHNSPSRFNYTYYHNVRRWYDRLLDYAGDVT